MTTDTADPDTLAERRARSAAAQRHRRAAIRAEKDRIRDEKREQYADKLQAVQKRVATLTDEMTEAAAERRKVVAEAHAAGVSVSDMAEIMGIGASGVYPLLVKAKQEHAED